METRNSPWHTAYIGLGSNLNDPAARLDEARERLAQEPGLRITRVSRYYATPPMGVTEQPWFVNAVAELETRLAPAQLLARLLALETAMGRVRQQRWGPRSIDLDLLLYDDLILDTDTLVLPHPEMHRRDFVLVPLVEVAPGVWHPRLGKTASQLLRELAPTTTIAPMGKGNAC